MAYSESTARSVRYWLDSQASVAAGTPAASRMSLTSWSSRLSSQCRTSAMPRPLVAAANSMGARNLVPMVFQNRCSGRCSSVGVCSIALASWTAVCWAPAQVAQEASGLQRAALTPEAPSGSITSTWPQPGPVGQGGPQQVRLHAGGDQRPGPFQDGGDDQGRGLVAAGGAEHQHRVAVLGRQQPPERARGAAQDHPARLGLAHGQQPQLPTAGPGGGMLGRPVRGRAGGRPPGPAGAAGPRRSRRTGRRPGR